MNNALKNHVVLFSDPNFIALTLFEYLLSKNFLITIYTTNKKEWLKQTDNLSKNSRFRVTDDFDNLNFNGVNYSICIEGFDDTNKSKFKINPIVKTLVIVPFEKYSYFKNQIPQGSYLSTLYIGDVIGTRMKLKNDLLITKMIGNIIKFKKFEVPVGELFYPIFVLDLAKQIFDYMFSFGPYGKSMLILGEETSSQTLWKINSAFFNNIEFKVDTKSLDRKLPVDIERKIIKSDLNIAFKQTYKWLFDNTQNVTVSKKKQKLNINYVKPFLAVMFAVVSPLVALLISAIIYYSCLANYSANKIQFTNPFLVYTRESSRFFSSIPLIGKYYKELVFISDNALLAGDLSTDGVPLLTHLSELPNKVLGNEVYDLVVFYNSLKPNIDNVSQKYGLLVKNINKDYYTKSEVKKLLETKIDIKKSEILLAQMDNILSTLEDVLGQNKRKTYLILFQNNMELRPTGGFIGSYGLATFEKGRMTDLNVSDVYSADGQLKGHVEPPSPIKTYLGEANWFLRDSNWDPDYIVSAKRAEWFLDKEIGTSVDGVLALDLSPIKDMLDITGPIFLSDYNMEITSSNLYEKTQQEVEGNFFAGSRKKASFLTALSRNLLSKFSNMSSKDKIKMLSLVYSNLEERHIQVYFHNLKLQDSVNKLGWDGGVKYSICKDDCFADTAGVVEANLGVNKVNQFVDRSVDIDIDINNGKLTRKMVVNLKNSANPSLGPSGLYQVYVRALKNGGITGDADSVWAEVLPNSGKSIEFTWQEELPENFDLNNYKFYFRKQAGIDGLELNLTVNGKNLYNRHLDKDLFVNYK